MNKQEYEKMFYFEDFYWWYWVLHRLVLKNIKKYTSKKQPKIIDVGCGTGKLVSLLIKDFKDVIGIDYSSVAIELANKRGIKNCYLQDIRNWNITETYDVIISLDVLCVFNLSVSKNILQKFSQSLNFGGIIILNLPAFDILKRNHDRAVDIKQRFNNKKLKSILPNNLQIEFLSYRLLYAFPILLLKKIFEKFFNRPVRSDLGDIPFIVNELFKFFGLIENSLLEVGINLPLGSSLFAILRKV